MFDKICTECGKRFDASNFHRPTLVKFCSPECRISQGIRLRRSRDNRVSLDLEDAVELHSVSEETGLPVRILGKVAVRLLLFSRSKGKVDVHDLMRRFNIRYDKDEEE